MTVSVSGLKYLNKPKTTQNLTNNIMFGFGYYKFKHSVYSILYIVYLI